MGLTDEELDNLEDEMMDSSWRSGRPHGDQNHDGDLGEEGKTPPSLFKPAFRLEGLAPALPVPESSVPESKESAGRSSGRKYLESYCISLTDRAREGKLDRLVGRDDELERVIQILNRRQSNPALLASRGSAKLP